MNLKPYYWKLVKFNSLLALFFSVAIVLIAAAVKPQTSKALANVDQKEGIYIFMLSKPAAEYQYMGSVEKKGIVMSGKPEEMLNIMLKKARKEYPQADGLIFSELNMYKADCIKFK